MLAIAAAAVFGFALLIDLLNTDFGAPDLFNWNTLVLIGLLLYSLYTWPSMASASAALAAGEVVAGPAAGARVAADPPRFAAGPVCRGIFGAETGPVVSI